MIALRRGPFFAHAGDEIILFIQFYCRRYIQSQRVFHKSPLVLWITYFHFILCAYSH